MSLRSGSEIMPSGRTGVVRLIAGLFHTAMSSTSSGPMRKSDPAAPALGAEADGVEGVGGADVAAVWAEADPAARHNSDPQISIRIVIVVSSFGLVADRVK